jgi:hypothetical protein
MECNREVKQLRIEVREAYNRRKLGQQYRGELNRLSKQLLLAKKTARVILKLMDSIGVLTLYNRITDLNSGFIDVLYFITLVVTQMC